MGTFNYKIDGALANDAGTSTDRGYVAKVSWTAADATASSTTGIHAAVTDTGEEVTITEDITNPSCARNITATAGGTAADIGAIQVTITGTNVLDEEITEDLPAFTVDTAGTVQGNKAFKTVTSITIPAHDGTGATTAIGVTNKLGLPYKLSNNTVLKTYINNTLESTDTTVAVSSTNIENNTILCNTALSGKAVDCYLIVD